MLKDLVKVAAKLDSLGLRREANFVDSLIRKVAGEGSDLPYGDIPLSTKRESPNKSGRFDTFSSGDSDYNEHMKKVKIVMDRTGLSEDEAEDLLMKVEMENEFGGNDSMTTSYNPHFHGIPSYEMDTDSIHEGIDSDRELDRINEMYPTETSFRRSSSNRRGMRKRS